MHRSKLRKVELLAPAGNFEKLEIVLHYGADAVYLAGKAFSLRDFSGNFSFEEIETAVHLAHDYGAKVYVAANIFARPAHLPAIEDYIRQLKKIRPDGLIVSDPAIITIVRRSAPELMLHLSTQANTTNHDSVRFWYQQGIHRINAARELSLAEIEILTKQCEAEIEVFVHGAMCISYSGRCLMSNYMARRPSNQGMCCQPCRFQYTVMEETRPGQYFPIAEDEHGTYIFNSKDLCMIEHIPEMIQTGIRALKIEGRMKGIHYAATAVKIYREALDRYFADPESYTMQPYWLAELKKITSRGYCTGFYLDQPDQRAPSYKPSTPPTFALAGKVLASAGKNRAHIEVRNKIRTGEAIEILKPNGPPIFDRIATIINAEGDKVAYANPGSHVTIDLGVDCQRFDLLRQAVQLKDNSRRIIN